jgi:hypothetical protein
MANTYTQIYIHAAKKEARIHINKLLCRICGISALSEDTGWFLSCVSGLHSLVLIDNQCTIICRLNSV